MLGGMLAEGEAALAEITRGAVEAIEWKGL
jgi:hypothetical protein